MVRQTLFWRGERSFALLWLERGQGLIEYSLIISLVVIVAMLTVGMFGEGTLNYYSNITSNVVSALAGG